MWMTIHADGGFTEHPDWDDPSLETMQGVVGGLIEAIPRLYCPQPVKVAWANEEGMLLGLPINQIATTLFGITLFGDILMDYDKEAVWGEDLE